jgi:hypothetical protein
MFELLVISDELILKPGELGDFNKTIEDKMKNKLSSASYGAKTRERAVKILDNYNQNVSTYHAFPPDSCTVDDLLLWSLNETGFETVSSNKSADSCHYRLRRDASFHDLRVVIFGNQALAYLDDCGIMLDLNPADPVRSAVRFAFACIYPCIMQTPLPELTSMPVDVVCNVATFLSIEDMGILSFSNASVMSALSNDTVWMYVFNNLSRYCSSEIPKQPPPLTCYKEAVRDILVEKQKRRLTRFVRTVQVSDWATPGRLIDPLGDIRRRRIDVMDDLNLF